MHRTESSFAWLVMASWMLLAAHVASAEDSAVGALKAEVAQRGWLVFSAHPAEIDNDTILHNKKDRGQLDLYLSRPDGSQLRKITHTERSSEVGAQFLSGGQKVFFRRIRKDQPLNHDLWGEWGELVIANPDGSDPVVHGRAGEFPWASFSPDEKQIACLFKKEQKIRIFDFPNKRLVQEMPAQGIFQQLYWSPDGKRLVGTANVAGRRWNVVSIDLATEKLTLLTRALNCTPDWFQGDAERVIYSNRNPALFPGDNYGLTVLMWASTDGKTRKLICGSAHRHCYFGCTSPDDKYVVFADDTTDGIFAGDLHVVRLADAPIIPDGMKQIRLLYPTWKDGPVWDLKLESGVPLRGFEPDWTYATLNVP